MTTDPTDERELMRRVGLRDEAAFAELFAGYREAVSTRIRGIVRDDDAANDLVQEAFLKVWTRADQWRGGAVKPWILRIATNCALNHLRTVKRRRETPLDLPTDPMGEREEISAPDWMIDASALGPQEALELAEQQRLARRLVSELPEDKREALRLIAEDGFDTSEAAEHLGVPEGTIRSRLHHARKRLAGQWSQEWEDAQ